MEIRITSRHTHISGHLRERAREAANKLSRYEPRISATEIVFVAEKHSKRVEGIVYVDRGDPVVASAEADEFLTALRRSIDRLARQLRRRNEQRRDHQAPKLSEALVEE